MLSGVHCCLTPVPVMSRRWPLRSNMGSPPRTRSLRKALAAEGVAASDFSRLRMRRSEGRKPTSSQAKDWCRRRHHREPRRHDRGVRIAPATGRNVRTPHLRAGEPARRGWARACSVRPRRAVVHRLAHAYFVRCDRRAGWSADDCVDHGALVCGSDALATSETQCTVVSSDLLWRCRARSGLPRSE